MNVRKLVTSFFVVAIALLSLGSADVFAKGSNPSTNANPAYSLTLACTAECEGAWPHSMLITSTSLFTGDFTATGADLTNDNDPWTMTGEVSGSAITFILSYVNDPSYTIEGSGTVAVDGSITATAVSVDGEEFSVSSSGGILAALRAISIGTHGNRDNDRDGDFHGWFRNRGYFPGWGKFDKHDKHNYKGRGNGKNGGKDNKGKDNKDNDKGKGKK